MGVSSYAAYQPRELAQAINNSRFVQGVMGGNETLQTLVTRSVQANILARQYRLDTIFAHKEGVIISPIRLWQIETYTFTYKSVSAKGEPIVLSGRVSFPNSREKLGHEVSSLSLYVHPFYVDESIAPSLDLSPLTLRTLFNSAVIEPDLEGLGVTEEMIANDISFPVLGRQVIDCALAALDVMYRQGVTLAPSGSSTIWSYSLSAPIAAAAARYCDMNLPKRQQDLLRFSSMFCGGGPLLINKLLDYVESHPDYSALYFDLWSLPTLPTSYFAPYQVKDFFPMWMQHYQLTFDGETMTYYEAMLRDKIDAYGKHRPEMYPNDVLKNNLAADMFTSEGRLDNDNEKTKILKSILDRFSDWSGWNPSMDIYLTHCTRDEYISIVQTRQFYHLYNAQDKIHYREYQGRKIGDNTYHYSSTIAAIVNMILFEEPSVAYNAMW